MIYFASDVHLGLVYGQSQKDRETHFVDWLKGIEADCNELFLVGDIFDFWFEWNSVVPKGFIRTFAQLLKMSERGIKIHFFVGNHDKWAVDYFEKELGAAIYFKERLFEREGVKFLVVHGDGLGKSDTAGRALTGLFNSHSARWLFQRCLHPDVAMRFGRWWSSGNRHKRGSVSHVFKGENEALVKWAKNELETTYKDLNVDYVVVGHLHTPIIYKINDNSKLVVLGEWIEKPTFAKLIGGSVELIEVEQFC